MGIWDLVTTFLTPFMESPMIVLVIVILLLGADAGVFSGNASNITYTAAVHDPNLVVIHSLFGYCVKPVLISTGAIIPNTAIANSLSQCVYIANPDGSRGVNASGSLLTELFTLFGVPIKITSFTLFVLLILATVGFWALTALTRS
jgi:hypothetical protein